MAKDAGDGLIRTTVALTPEEVELIKASGTKNRRAWTNEIVVLAVRQAKTDLVPRRASEGHE